MRQTWELLIGWHELVIRIPRMRRNPHQLTLPLPPTTHQLTNIPTMFCSNLHDGVPFKFLSSHVAGEVISPWDCCKFPCTCANSMVAYPTDMMGCWWSWSFHLMEIERLCPQIGLMTTHGYICPGWVNGFQEVEWRNDPLANCHNMDALWGFMIQAEEQCHMSVPADLRDLVL